MNCGSTSAKDWPCKACKIQACQGCTGGTSGFGHVLNDKTWQRECEKVDNTVFPHSILQRLCSPVSMLARTGSTKSNSCRFKKKYIKISFMLCLVKLIETMHFPLSYFNFLELLSLLLIYPVLSDQQIKKRFLFLFFIFRKHVMQVSTFHPQLWEFQTVWAERLRVCDTVIWSQHLKNIVIVFS